MGGSKHDITRRDFGFGDVFRISTRIYTEHFGKIAMIGIGIYLPIKALMAYLAPPDVSGVRDQFEVYMAEGIFDLLFGSIALLLVIRLTANAIDGAPTTLSHVWKQAKGRYFSFVAGMIAMQIVLLGLLFLLVIPGLAGYVYMTFFMQVIALREETGFHALKQSKRVVEGSFWMVALYVLLFEVGAALLFLDALAPSRGIGALLGTLGGVLSLYFIVVATVLYLRLERTRFGTES